MGEVRALRPLPPPDAGQLLFSASEQVQLLVPGGMAILADPVYGDDVWPLAGHRSWKAKAGAQTTLDFTQLHAHWRDLAKHVALLQMSPALALERYGNSALAQTWVDSQEPVLPVTAQGNLKMLAHSLAIVDRHQLTTFDDETWERIALLLITPKDKTEKREGTALSPLTGRGRAQQLIAAWQVAHMLGSDQLGDQPPFAGRDTTQLYTRRTQRNSVRPDENVGHLLGFTAWVIDTIAEDIVEHIEWWATNTETEPAATRQGRYEAMLDLICRIAADNDNAVPASRNVNGGTTLAHSGLGRLLGIYDPDDAFEAGRWALSQLRDQVTLSTDVTPSPLPISTVTTPAGPVTWAPRLLPTLTELDAWQRYLVYACMYYLSATLMLRDSQLALLALNPLEVVPETAPDGHTYDRYELHAYRTKNRHSPIPTTVTVSTRVARIFALLRRLQAALGYEPQRTDLGHPMLFDQRLAVPHGKDPHGMARLDLHLDLGFVKLMRKAARELYDRGVIARHLDDVTVNARQVRITCAQAYATREHGAALAAAFGQWDTRHVAAGYVGDVYKRLITPVDPEDAQDIIDEAKGRTLVRAKQDRNELTGRGLPRLDDALEMSSVPLANPDPLTPARLRRLGKQNRNVHRGTLTICVFQAEGALCAGRAGPDFAKCAPGQCRNSVMTRPDRARYELRRREYLTPDTPVGRRGARKLADLNPDIATEFADTTDAELRDIVKASYEDWVNATLEQRP